MKDKLCNMFYIIKIIKNDFYFLILKYWVRHIMSKVCCYFCEDLYLYPDESFFIENYNGIWVCQENSNYCKLFKIKDNIECPICFENKKSVELYCKHEICIDCCKKIFIGTSEYKKPIHPKEITIEYPKWIFDIDEDDELFTPEGSSADSG